MNIKEKSHAKAVDLILDEIFHAQDEGFCEEVGIETARMVLEDKGYSENEIAQAMNNLPNNY